MPTSGIGLREQGGGGPSAMALLSAHQGQGDLGAHKAAELSAYQLAQQQKYAVPIGGSPLDPNGPSWMNYNALEPSKITIPTASKERMMAREELRRSVPAHKGVTRTDPITDDEVSYIQAMKRQAELLDFDRYVNMLVDPMKPGNLKWLMEVYPEFVHRRIAQVHDDYDFAIRNQMIDTWGINTLDDLHFKYLVDQGKITGAKLGKRDPLDRRYTVGILAPYRQKDVAGDKSDGAYLKMPFASKEGNASWLQSNQSQPLGEGSRAYQDLARQMYNEQEGE